METIRNKYLIYATTNWCWITQYFGGMIVPVFVLLIAIPENHLIIFFIFLLFLNVLIWHFAQTFLLQPIEITLTEDRIYLKYLNNKLTKAKKEISTTTDKISGFSDYTVNQELKFKLYFSHGQTFTLHKSGMWNRNDDFELLIEDFKIYIKRLNQKSTIGNNGIPRKKIKYGDNTYLNFGLYFLILAFIFGFSYFFSEINETNIIRGLIFILLLIALGIFNLFHHRDSNDKIKDE